MKLRPGRFSASLRAPVGTANLPPQSSTSVTRRYPTKSSNTGFLLADERTDTRACKLLEVAIKLRKRLCFCHPAGPRKFCSRGATVEMTAFNGFRRGSDTTPVASGAVAYRLFGKRVPRTENVFQGCTIPGP